MGFCTVASGGTTSCRETKERMRREKTGEGRITHHGMDLSRSVPKTCGRQMAMFGKDPTSGRKDWTLFGSTGSCSEFFSNILDIIASHIGITLSPSYITCISCFSILYTTQCCKELSSAPQDSRLPAKYGLLRHYVNKHPSQEQ